MAKYIWECEVHDAVSVASGDIVWGEYFVSAKDFDAAVKIMQKVIAKEKKDSGKNLRLVLTGVRRRSPLVG